jgi:hypothetical protein
VRDADRPLIFAAVRSQGRDYCVDGGASFHAEAADSIYYLQDFVPPSGANFEDWRVIVTRNRVVAAMTRRAGNWITNVHQGGSPSPHLPSDEMEQLAAGALAAVGGDYGGVDLIRTPDGRLWVLEVNSNPSWRGLQSVSTSISPTRSWRISSSPSVRISAVSHAQASEAVIGGLFLAAAAAPELAALKPGNVHVHAGGHGMEMAQFRRPPP